MKEVKTFIFSGFKFDKDQKPKIVQIYTKAAGVFFGRSEKENLTVDIDYADLKKMIEIEKWKIINIIPLSDWHWVGMSGADDDDGTDSSLTSILVMERDNE